MGKKKFIDKKKSATFHILSRDSSDPNYQPGPSGDRIFCRVDNNPYAVDGFGEPDDGELDDNHDGIFDDAPGDHDSDEGNDFGFGISGNGAQKKPLLDHIRKEILELGLPDDGYNYLLHMREMKTTGGGSAYYENPKAQFNPLPQDVKAYDASRVDVPKLGDDNDDSNEKLIYSVAEKTVGVRIQKAMDPDVAAMLDDSDYSQFGSDVEEGFDDDFVIKANPPEDPVDDEKLKLANTTEVVKMVTTDDLCVKGHFRVKDGTFEEKPRVRRAIDEQFDMLELQEYRSESEDDCNDYADEENDCQASLAEKLNHAFKLYSGDGSEVNNGNQRVPPDPFLNNKMSNDEESMESAPDVIRRCREYAEKYENESQDEEAVLFEESSSESEKWDCDTIVSTYSNLDNHPGTIEAPGVRRKKKLATISEISNSSVPIISLKGKEKLPVDFLPNRVKNASGIKEGKRCVKEEESKAKQYKRKQHGQESKEEKKERKAAVKEEKREARREKKEMKELYKSESQLAQKVAAFTGPSGRRLM